MTLIGPSTSVLDDKLDFDRLLSYQPEVIEFYNYTSAELDVIELFCAKHDIRIALHTPTPYDEIRPLTRFAPSGPDPEEVMFARRLTIDTIQAAERLNAVHVVVHFPTPYSDVGNEQIDQASIESFFDPIVLEADRLGVRVLVENLSSHPSFHLPIQYLQILEQYENLRFCLDIGHAQQQAPAVTIADYINVVGNKIQSCHIYNWSKSKTGHTPPHIDQLGETGWIDLPNVIGMLHRDANLSTFILEIDPQPISNTQYVAEGARWVKSLLRSNN